MYAQGASLNYIHSNGITPMYLAVKGNHIEVVRMMLREGVPIYNQEEAHRDNSPIFFALKLKNMIVLDAMCEK